jgi:hypothetical protein
MVKHHDAQLSSATQKIEAKLYQQKLQAAIDGIKNSSNMWLDPDFFVAAPATPASNPLLPNQ